jgi:hypothetical protein
MISRTRSRVEVGEDLAVFRLVMPRGRALPDSSGSVVGRPIGFDAKYAAGDIEYNLTMTVKYSSSGTVSSAYVDAFKPAGPTAKPSLAETINTFGTKLATHNRKDAAEVPPGVRGLLPELVLEQVSEKQKAFSLRLPPYTAMYSSKKGFFETLGFDPKLVETSSNEGSETASGFWNWSQETRIARSSSWYGTEMMAEGWNMFADPPQEPGKIRLTRALLDHTVSAVSNGLQPAMKNTAMGILSGMLEVLLARSGLPDDTVELEMGEDDEMILSNKETDGSMITVELIFDATTARFLQMGVPTLTFPLYDRRSYVLEPRDLRSDPLENRYPISLVMQGHGEAVNYIQGMGHVPLLGHLAGPGDLHGPATTFNLSEQFLSLRLVDKHLRVMRFKDPLELFLTLELHPLSS